METLITVISVLSFIPILIFFGWLQDKGKRGELLLPKSWQKKLGL